MSPWVCELWCRGILLPLKNKYKNNYKQITTKYLSLFYFLTVFLTNIRFSLESEWQQVSSSLQELSENSSYLHNAIVWMVSILPSISICSNPLSKPMRTVPSAPTTIGITVTHMFHSLFDFFSSLTKPKYLFIFFTFFDFHLVVHYMVSSLIFFSFFFFVNYKSGLLAGIRWSVFISKSQRVLSVSFSRTDSSLCMYHLVVESDFNFLHNSQWILPPLCLVLYFLYTSLQHMLIMWLIVSSQSRYDLHLQFCCVLLIIILI